MFKLMERTLRAVVVPQLARQCHNQKSHGGRNSCGIPPFKDPTLEKKLSLNAPQKIQFKLPGHLVRPPCVAGSEPGKEQTCKLEAKGMFCPVNRIRYKYPAFSENMGPIRGDGKVCWWFRETKCDYNKEGEANMHSRTDVQIYK